MKYNQKNIGNKTEKEFAEIMFNKGWWVHLFADKISGQPFDIVMCRSEVCWFIDVKHVQDKNYFLHSRIEPNQINAFKTLNSRGMHNTSFVIKFSDGWYMVKFKDIDFSKNKTEKDKMMKLSISLYI
jgi:Holliday junction resolvase